MEEAEPLYGDVLGAGALVGDAVVDELVGQGGFARVYAARDGRGARVAVKVLHRDLALSSRAIRRFHQEAEAASLLRHACIVGVRGAGCLHDGRPYLVLEWLDGRHLGAAVAARGALPVAETLAIVRQLAAALGVAHDSGIVHRDLKPENVMLVAEGAAPLVKVLDFGVAKLLERPAGAAPSGATTYTFAGTPAYMAPEQIRGEPVDARTDVYALGLLVHLMITGAPAFAAGDAVACEELHLGAPPPRASLVAPVPSAVDAVIARCLAKRREERFASAGEVALALAAALAEGAARVVAGRALRVTVPGLDAAADDEALDDADAALAAARAAVIAAGFRVVVELGDGFVAAAPGRPEVPPLPASLLTAVRDGDVELDAAGQVCEGTVFDDSVFG